ATCGHTAWRNNDDGPSTSVGELLPNAELKIIDEDGITELGVNQPGELYIRGPNIMKGYWNRPDATRAAFAEDGQWYKTGDIGYVTEEGLFYIVDRKKELIKVKGNQVAPAELEALLLQHPAVADAAVIGISRDYEEFPRAYIVIKPDHVASEKEFFEFISKRVHRTKRLTGGVRFVEAIPKNPSGKILRRALREQAKREEGANAHFCETATSGRRETFSKCSDLI
ncbi:Isocitrate dehydrogenase [NADP], mitochondrial precursor (Oxalosuccinate decarboxylase), partial [Ascosphaera pollenicola]